LENDRLTVALDAQRRGCASALPHDRHEHPGGS
jgi:hypothetical protein